MNQILKIIKVKIHIKIIRQENKTIAFNKNRLFSLQEVGYNSFRMRRVAAFRDSIEDIEGSLQVVAELQYGSFVAASVTVIRG